MTKAVYFTPAARLDLIDARAWYERKARGLGERFLSEVDFQAQRIAANASHFPLMFADVRRARLRRFPYGLFFREVDGDAYVIACFHSSRDPINWQGRI